MKISNAVCYYVLPKKTWQPGAWHLGASYTRCPQKSKSKVFFTVTLPTEFHQIWHIALAINA